ncbi:holo-[acyl-carrier-protein] synthase [Aquabacterium lacunae]|uniref:Holo-[acyl-carrier-protein] synthase n=1 Tax=Aquabacterium lacunae TaxID=2528630 RepID=A0A4Q9GVK7_9BURK|nr:holo-ACP synthase [Aquabacterium lacunae]TBO27906.1 holo-[acyl-carrier-protein] synthase [Aquabacterium lacunae]
MLSAHQLQVSCADLFGAVSGGHAGKAPGLGVDLVHVPRIARALDTFGERFLRRLFTAVEARDAGSEPMLRVERLAARFAAKEAAIKAFGLAEVGVSWRDLEVERLPGGVPVLRVHGRAAEVLRSRGIAHWALSLSHDGDHAVAVVAIVQPAVSAPSAP